MQIYLYDIVQIWSQSSFHIRRKQTVASICNYNDKGNNIITPEIKLIHKHVIVKQNIYTAVVYKVRVWQRGIPKHGLLVSQL